MAQYDYPFKFKDIDNILCCKMYKHIIKLTLYVKCEFMRIILHRNILYEFQKALKTLRTLRF